MTKFLLITVSLVSLSLSVSFSAHATVRTIAYLPMEASPADLKNACLGLTFNDTFCKRIEDATLRNYCYGVTWKVDACYGLEDNRDLFHSCRTMAKVEDDDIYGINECGRIKDPDLKRMCTAFIYHASTDCNKINSKYLRSYCQSVYWDFSGGPHCDIMPTEALKNYCLGTTYRSSYCEQIK